VEFAVVCAAARICTQHRDIGFRVDAPTAAFGDARGVSTSKFAGFSQQHLGLVKH
jgi:hypothetical protein